MSAINGIPKLPPPSQPVVADGFLTQPWRDYFQQVDDRLRRFITLYGAGSSTVAALPSAATAGAGARAFVTNANSTTFNSVVAGGGSNDVPVVSDGTDWRIG